MAENKDQDPGEGQAKNLNLNLKPATEVNKDSAESKAHSPNESLSDANENVVAFDLNELDQVIAEEDPQFIQQLGEIQISAPGLDLDNLQNADRVNQKNLIAQIKAIFQYSKDPKKFIKFWSTVILVIALLVYTWFFQKNFLNQKLFINSMAELGEGVNDYNPLSEVEDFYDNPKFSKNIVTVSKMVVNLKPSENSGPNPMLALEINVEGISADAIIEIKDREAEFKDLLLRSSEERSYDDLTTTEGKQILCDQFRDLINSHLTRGQVRRVYLKSFVIKP